MKHVQTVLLVDDDENDGDFFQRAVKHNNLDFKIHWAKNGKEAMDYLSGAGEYADRARFPLPEFIITDTQMPMVSGMEFLQWLKKHPQLSIVPTIIFAGHTAQENVDEAYKNLGIHSYIEKPQEYSDLKTVVKRIFDYWSICRVPTTNVKQ